MRLHEEKGRVRRRSNSLDSQSIAIDLFLYICLTDITLTEGGDIMKGLQQIAVILVIIGALNWGLVGLFGFNVVSSIFGVATWLTNLIYILVGLSGIVMLINWGKK